MRSPRLVSLRARRLGALLGAVLLAWLTISSGLAAAPAPVLVAHVEGAIDPIAARYLQAVVDTAERDGAGLLVVTLDTPGGLDASMRQMVQALLNTPTPTVVYVAPAGARAASAGVFIAQAATVTAMAPGTTIGAAHPVAAGGESLSGDLADKITNDAAAYLASIARQRGRNEVWVQEAVRHSAALDAQSAVEARVADLIAADLPALLRAIDGRTVTTTAGPVTLRTADAPVTTLEMQPAERFVQRLIDPTIAFLLLTIGFYALLIELFHPGAVAPGVTAVICLVLALVALASLPVNWGGVVLIAAAMALFVVDIKAATHGALTVAGLVCLVLGALLLYAPPGPPSPTLPAAEVAPPVLIAMTALGAALSLLLAGAAVRVRRQPALSAVDHLSGALGVTTGALTPRGTVQVGGQLWSARLHAGVLGPGQRVRVLARRGLTLEVEPVEPPEPPAAEAQ
jgi:membrane-bound serine protease (ClpP class)